MYIHIQETDYAVRIVPHVYDGITLSGSTVYTLQYIVTAQLNRLYSFTVTKEVQEELRLVVNRLESIVFDKEFKSKEMLNLTI